jgi:hypothetical protein
MKRAVSRICSLVPVTVAVALSAAPGHAQTCSGDSEDSSSITSWDTGNPLRVRTWSRTNLLHLQNHPTCAGILGVRSELWLEGSPTGCTAGPSYNPAPTARDSNAYHARETSRWCTVYLCGAYSARGRHYFNGDIYKATSGNVAPGGDCGGGTCNPCTPGYVSGGDCAPHLQDQCGCCPNPCPLILDRSGDGLQLSGADDGALLDINGHGAMFWLGWPTSPDDAWLVYDRNGNGMIDNGSELFGNTRRLASGANAENGYQVLAELDEDHNGAVDTRDPQFAKLLLWGDVNRNGVSEPSELTPLAATPIKSLAIDYRESEQTDKAGNRFRFVAVDRSSIDVFPVWDVPDSIVPDRR